MKHSLFETGPAVIGMVHFSPLVGSENFVGREIVLERARQDLSALVEGGVDAVIFENNFDTPKFATLKEAAAEHFTELIRELTSDLELPWGISALWNDYALGFRLCQEFGGMMVRVPVFADDVKTTYGEFRADSKSVTASRSKTDASRVLILADVQVKHAEMIQPRAFADSFKDTIDQDADAGIVTGGWTGEPPSVEECRLAREIAADRAYVLTGSGVNAESIHEYLPHVNGCIIGTAFKSGSVTPGDHQGPNVVEADRRYDVEKIRQLVRIVKDWKKEKAPTFR